MITHTCEIAVVHRPAGGPNPAIGLWRMELEFIPYVRM